MHAKYKNQKGKITETQNINQALYNHDNQGERGRPPDSLPSQGCTG